jgi:broad specificity phosphatase PhoE
MFFVITLERIQTSVYSETMLEVIFIRHGETNWNLGRRVMGDRPIPLNDTGRKQMSQLSNYFKNVDIDAIYTSPVVRAAESAKILANDRDIPVIDAYELAEINYGEWVGMTFDEVRHRPEFSDYHLCPSKAQVPGGESMLEVLERIGGFVERVRKEDEGKRIIAVSHADVIKVVLSKYLLLPLDMMHRMRIDNGSHSIVWFYGPLERVLAINALPRIDGFFEKTSLFAKEILYR